MLALTPGRSFESVFNASGLPGLVAQYGDWFSYDRSPRAQIFRRDQSLVHDVDSMIRLIRWVGSGEPESRGALCAVRCHSFRPLGTPGRAGVRPHPHSA